MSGDRVQFGQGIVFVNGEPVGVFTELTLAESNAFVGVDFATTPVEPVCKTCQDIRWVGVDEATPCPVCNLGANSHE